MGRSCSSFSSPTFLLRKHERQNDVVQHVHPLGLDFESCFLFLREVVRTMKFSDNRLFLIYGDQLWVVHPKCAHCPSVLIAIWTNKDITPFHLPALGAKTRLW